MNLDSIWIDIWKIVVIVGLGSFFLLVLIVIPFGARDLKRLFTTLDQNHEHSEDE